MSLKHKDILNEMATPQQVTDAIKKRYEVKINYTSDDDNKGGGLRLIQPVAYGTSKAGNPVIRAFQPFGDTKTKVPHWKMFRLDKIDKWMPMRNRKFEEPPHTQWGAEGNFNPNGDKSMANVFLVADFKGAKERYNDNLRKHNDEANAKKVAENPFYNLKKNIKNSVMATPEIMARIKASEQEKERKRSLKNDSSANDMKQAVNFGNNNITSTNGPITKDNNGNNNQNDNSNANMDYKKISNNGPIIKDNNKEEENIKDNGNK